MYLKVFGVNVQNVIQFSYRTDLENWYNFYSPEKEEISEELLNILLDDLNTPKKLGLKSNR